MKKLILLTSFLLISGCSFPKEVKNNTNIIKNETPEVEKPKEPEYVDNNPIEISMYLDNASGGLTKSSSEHHSTWLVKNDIAVFGSLLCTDEEKAPDYYQNTWASCAEKYQDLSYKIAWHIKFNIGEQLIDRYIYKPSDVSDFYDYLEIYLYDSANAPIGEFYSHLLEEQMQESTIITSLKLTAGTKVNEITSPIEVEVFTYDTEDDFDENNAYRGKSIYKVTVYND